MKRLRIAAAIAATALALVPLALAVTCSYTRYRSEEPYYITAIAEIYGTSSANSYGYARGETESAVCVISGTGKGYTRGPVCSCTGKATIRWDVGEAGDWISSDAYWYLDPNFYAYVIAFLQGYCSC